MRCLYTYILLIMVAVFTTSCKKRIKGGVDDNFGSGINGVSVTILNSNFHTYSDNNGRFEIDYVPGEIKLLYEKEGYTSDTQMLSIYKKSNYEAAEVMLIKKPDQKGVYYQSFGSYIPLTKVKAEKYDIASHWEKYTVEWYVVEHECVQIPYLDVGPQPLYNLVIQDFFKNNDGFISYPKCLALYKIYGDNGEFAILKGSVIEGAKIIKGSKIKMDFIEKDNTLLIKASLDYGRYLLTREAYAPWIATDPSFMFELVDTTKQKITQGESLKSKSMQHTTGVEEIQEFKGYITKIEGGNAVLTMTVSGEVDEETGDAYEQSFLLNSQTKITSNNAKYNAIGDLEDNLKINVKYTNSGGDIQEAKEIIIE